MKLGISHAFAHETPAQWAEQLRSLSLSAAVFPVEYTAKDSLIADYAAACKRHYEALGGCETGKATQLVCEKIHAVCYKEK